jgi:hypothetical protein
MNTPDEIVEMTDLTANEVAAIAEHEHTTGVLAAGMVAYLMHKHGGPLAINRMLREHIREALHMDDVPHARALYAMLHHFIATHPEAAQGPEE